MTRVTLRLLAAFLLSHALVASHASARVATPAIFGDHMVLQRDQANPVWGWASPGEKVTVTFNGQSVSATADDSGHWRVELAPAPAGGPHELVIKGENELTLKDVLVGEVWVCSGQSNMQWPINASNDPDLEKLTADYPNMRLITVPQYGTQTPQADFEGQWEACSAETIGDFSAVGYFFGRQLHKALDVPIGLIDNSWGGSAAEAWVRRDRLAALDRYGPLMERWEEAENAEGAPKLLSDYEQAQAEWNEANRAAKMAGEKPPKRPGSLRNQLVGNHRPGNLYNGVLKPVLGYGIRGVIWYQGESNAARAYQYRHLFPLMISSWREEWGQGDFPFYWVQLADFRDEKSEPAESDWAELREAQTMTMSLLPNAGEAVIIDLGEAHDIHPKNKRDVGRRLARWALSQDYGIDVAYRSPQLKSVHFTDGKAIVDFEHVRGGLDTFDVREPIGFAVAGEDRKFHWAKANIASANQVEVSSEAVPNPVAVRYAWADNPVCNLQSREGLPVTPFRSDNWPGVTINNHR